MGRKPIVVIADPDILRQVMVKEFSSFPNRLVRATPAGNHALHAPQSVFLTANLCVVCAETCYYQQAHVWLPALPERWHVEEGAQRPDPVLQRRQNEGGETWTCLLIWGFSPLAPTTWPSPYGFSDKCWCLLHCAADGPPHQHGQRRPDDQPECLRRVRRILWHLQVILTPQLKKNRLTLYRVCVGLTVCFLQVFWLLHHGRHRQRGFRDPRGLSEPRGRPLCPPREAVLFFFLLQANHAFILLVENIFSFSENIDFCMMVESGEADTLTPLVLRVQWPFLSSLLWSGFFQTISETPWINSLPAPFRRSSSRGRSFLLSRWMWLSYFHFKLGFILLSPTVISRDAPIFFFTKTSRVRVFAFQHSPIPIQSTWYGHYAWTSRRMFF